jgi:hypothetical protein
MLTFWPSPFEPPTMAVTTTSWSLETKLRMDVDGISPLVCWDLGAKAELLNCGPRLILLFVYIDQVLDLYRQKEELVAVHNSIIRLWLPSPSRPRAKSLGLGSQSRIIELWTATNSSFCLYRSRTLWAMTTVALRNSALAPKSQQTKGEIPSTSRNSSTYMNVDLLAITLVARRVMARRSTFMYVELFLDVDGISPLVCWDLGTSWSLETKLRMHRSFLPPPEVATRSNFRALAS